MQIKMKNQKSPKSQVTLDQMMAFIEVNIKGLESHLMGAINRLDNKIEALRIENAQEHEEMKDMIQEVMGVNDELCSKRMKKHEANYHPIAI